jgi:hypothetical protein
MTTTTPHQYTFGSRLAASRTAARLAHLLSASTLMVLGGALLFGCGHAERTRPRPAAPAMVTLTDAGTPSGAYAIDGPHSLARGAVRFAVTNDGKTERGAALVAVAGDHSVDETFTALSKARDGAPTPNWVRWAGGIGVIHPGQRGTFTVDLTPGRYYVIDRSFQGKPAAVAKLTAKAQLEITQQGKPAPLPTAGSSITASEYRFRVRGLAAGRHTVRLENAGIEPHNFVVSPIREGKTLADVKKYVADGSGAPPVDFSRETISGTLAGGTRENLPLDLKPGRYALLCFASDRAGGPPHVAKGMLNEVTVR